MYCLITFDTTGPHILPGLSLAQAFRLMHGTYNGIGGIWRGTPTDRSKPIYPKVKR